MSVTIRERFWRWQLDDRNSSTKWTSPMIAEVAAFAESEVRRALQPTAPSPELAEAEKWLREDRGFHTSQGAGMARIIASEMDRRAAEIVGLEEQVRSLGAGKASWKERWEARCNEAGKTESSLRAELATAKADSARLRDFANRVRDANKAESGSADFCTAVEEALLALDKETT